MACLTNVVMVIHFRVRDTLCSSFMFATTQSTLLYALCSSIFETKNIELFIARGVPVWEF